MSIFGMCLFIPIFPLNIIFIYLLYKAYSKDSSNILYSLGNLSKEYFDLFRKKIEKWYNKYKNSKINTDRIGRWRE